MSMFSCTCVCRKSELPQSPTGLCVKQLNIIYIYLYVCRSGNTVGADKLICKWATASCWGQMLFVIVFVHYLAGGCTLPALLSYVLWFLSCVVYSSFAPGSAGSSSSSSRRFYLPKRFRIPRVSRPSDIVSLWRVRDGKQWAVSRYNLMISHTNTHMHTSAHTHIYIFTFISNAFVRFISLALAFVVCSSS